MATATAKKTKTGAAKTAKPTKHHQAIVDAVEALDGPRLDWIGSGAPIPSEQVYDALEAVILAVADDESEAAWPRSSWRFLEAATEAARCIDRVGTVGWRSPHARPAAKLWGACLEMSERQSDLVDPPAEPQPRRIPLETLEQLDRLPNMNDERVAMVWALKTPDGQPDRARVQAIRAGEEKAPTETILPAVDNRPKRRPHIGLVASVADWLRADRG